MSSSRHINRIGIRGRWLPRAIISVHRGIIAVSGTTNTATIPAVHMDSAVAHFLGVTTDHAGAFNKKDRVTVVLTDATTVTVTRTDSTDNITARYEVVEYVPGVLSVQRGIVSISGTSNTASINSVDTRKSYLAWGNYTTSVDQNNSECDADLALTDSITVTGTKVDATGTSVMVFQVVTFK